MKRIGKKAALVWLDKLKTNYRQRISIGYEHRAKSCETCETKGACCLDAHFVNVHITQLETVAIKEVLAKLSESQQDAVNARIRQTVDDYSLANCFDSFTKTYPCPLFEKDSGCLVHAVKPIPCIQHACYENLEDLPPDDLQVEIEAKIDKLNQQTYGKTVCLPLPVSLLQK